MRIRSILNLCGCKWRPWSWEERILTLPIVSKKSFPSLHFIFYLFLVVSGCCAPAGLFCFSLSWSTTGFSRFYPNDEFPAWNYNRAQFKRNSSISFLHPDVLKCRTLGLLHLTFSDSFRSLALWFSSSCSSRHYWTTVLSLPGFCLLCQQLIWNKWLCVVKLQDL